MTTELTKSQIDDFFNDGYIVLKDFFTNEQLGSIEKAYVRLYAMQAAKILKYRNKLSHGDRILEYSDGDDLIEILELMEELDKEVLYQVQKLSTNSYFLKQFVVNQKLIEFSSQLLNCPKEIVLFDDVGLMINRPQTKRLLYKWHSEDHYYPKRQNFLNLYFPLFFEKNLENGHMLMAKKSHKLHDTPFIEYQGFDTDSFGKKNYFLQMQVPKSIVDNYEKIPAIVNRCDAILFHRKLIHSSTPNVSSKYSFAGVCRIWEPTKDMTFSGDFKVRPYSGDIGIPDMDIIKLF